MAAEILSLDNLTVGEAGYVRAIAHLIGEADECRIDIQQGAYARQAPDGEVEFIPNGETMVVLYLRQTVTE